MNLLLPFLNKRLGSASPFCMFTYLTICCQYPTRTRAFFFFFFLFFQDLLGSMGLMSTNTLEQHAAIGSLSTLMSIIPSDTFLEFEKVSCACLQYFSFWHYLVHFHFNVLLSLQHLKEVPDRTSHDTLSENDIKVIQMHIYVI